MLLSPDADLPLSLRIRRWVQRIAIVVALACCLGLLATKTGGATLPPREPLAGSFLAAQALATGAVPNGVVTNSGFDPTVQPTPPTVLFGGVPVLGRVAQRLAAAFATGLSWSMGLLGLIMLSLYGLVALPFGLRNRFLVRQQAVSTPAGFALDALRRFVAPALVEETIFRVLLLPHPVEGVPGDRWLLWGIVSFVAFILYHVVLDKTLYRGARAGLSDPRFLVLAGWLGLVLIAAYWITGSLWLVVLMHWAVVLVWIYRFGGWARLHGAGRSARGAIAGFR